MSFKINYFYLFNSNNKIKFYNDLFNYNLFYFFYLMFNKNNKNIMICSSKK